MRKTFKNPEDLKDELEGPQAADEKFEKILSNAYFFGQFMMLHMLLKMHKAIGYDQVLKFMRKKYKDIGVGNEHFINQAEKQDHLIMKYHRDTMGT